MKRSGGKVHSMRDNWCRVFFVAKCPSSHQPEIDITGTHPFLNHQLTPEEMDFASFYVYSQTSVPTGCILHDRCFNTVNP